MKFTRLLKFATFVLALPAFGVAVAATSVNSNVANNEEVAASANSVVTKLDGRQDDEKRANWVRLTATGGLNGRISVLSGGGYQGASGLAVNLVRNGQILYTTVTNSSGSFMIPGVQPGVYSLVGTGANGFVSSSLYALPAEADAADVKVSSNLIVNQLDILAVSSVAAVESILRGYLPGLALNGNEATQEAVYAKASRQSLFVPSASENVNINDLADRFDDAVPATSIKHHPVALVNGRFNGQLSQIHGTEIDFTAITVYVLRGAQIVAQAGVNADGSFEVAGVGAGVYSLVTASSSAVGVLGFELVDAGSGQANLDSEGAFQLASYLNVAGDDLSMSPAAGGDVSAVMNNNQNDDDDSGFVPTPSGGGGGVAPSYSGGGGGGGGGGLGGLGGLSGLAAIAAVAFAAGNDDGSSGDTTIISPASPF